MGRAQARGELALKRQDRCVTDASLSRVLERAAALHGCRPAIADGSVRLSYRELTRQAVALAGALRARGIKAGDRVAIL